MKRWKTAMNTPPPTLSSMLHFFRLSIRRSTTTNIVNPFHLCIAYAILLLLLWTPPRTIWILNWDSCVTTANKKPQGFFFFFFFCTLKRLYSSTTSLFLHHVCVFFFCFVFAGTGFNKIVVAVYIFLKLFGMYAKWNNLHAIFRFGARMCARKAYH